MMNKIGWSILVLLVCCTGVMAQQEGMVPFAIPAKANPDSLVKMPSSSPIEIKSERITVKNGKFFVGNQRIKIWGVNIAGTVSPSHEESEQIAARMAQAGVNSVRLHGIEFGPFWKEGPLSAGEAAGLDRFDYFVAQLAKHGIYSNFNLHTYRRYSLELKLPEADKVPGIGDKLIDIFTPQLIEAQKKHARILLNHVNPYRKVRYADDPAVAFIEINNENSLFLWDAETLYPQMPPYFINIIQGRFNDYLKSQYGTTQKLKAAWGEALGKDESLEAGKVKFVAAKEAEVRRIDRFKCLMEVEKGYWEDLYNLVKKELGSKALVTGTILFGPCNLYAQQNMDWIDCHAYWGHPRWNKDVPRWDPVRWTVPSTAMVDSPHQTITDLDRIAGLMFYMASQQYKGKPYTNSEYNHPAPNDYQAECVPLMATFGAMQDWDGVWLYCYEGGYWDGRRFSWFDLDTNSSKWGFLQAGAAIFREKQMDPLVKTQILSFTHSDKPLVDLCKHQIKRNYDTFTMLQDQYGVSWKDFLNTRLVTSLDKKDNAKIAAQSPEKSNLTWDVAKNGHGRYVARGAGAIVWMGHKDRLNEGNFVLENPDFAVVSITAMDNQPFEKSKKILITAIKRCENTGMKFTPKRDSVGSNWGGPPVIIEPIKGSISGLAFLKGDWTCRAIGPDGKPTANVPLTVDEKTKTLVVKLSPEYKTMWYLLTR